LRRVVFLHQAHLFPAICPGALSPSKLIQTA